MAIDETSEDETINTSNMFFVGMAGNDVATVMIPPRTLTHDQAVNLIGWLVVLLDIQPETIEAQRQAIENI